MLEGLDSVLLNEDEDDRPDSRGEALGDSEVDEAEESLPVERNEYDDIMPGGRCDRPLGEVG